MYLDDILILSNSLQEHCKHVRLVLQHLLENKLFAKKCYHSRKISFLKFTVDQGQVSADPGKRRAVKEWSIPENIKDLQHFLGFANFQRCFIHHFSHLKLETGSLGTILQPVKLYSLLPPWFL